jgi:uncharacterized protein
MIIDAFEFARKALEASGSIAVADLTRVDVLERSGLVAWEASGSSDANGKPFLDIAARGKLMLACQRCLEPMVHDVVVDAHLLLVRSDAEAEAVPIEDLELDAVVASESFDLTELIEDEIILSLPLVPKHERCAEEHLAGDASQDDQQEMARESPFAILAGHRKHKLGS